MAALLVLCGCRPADDAPQAPAGATSQVTAPSETNGEASSGADSGPTSRPTIQVVDADGLKRLIDENRGKVVLLDFWATWCAPCIEALPELDPLQRRFGPRGLHVIAVSFDDARALARAAGLLNKAGWRGPSCGVPDRDAQNELVSRLGTNWRSELPARFLIDREGRVAHEILESTTDAPPLVELIEKVLAAKPAGG